MATFNLSEREVIFRAALPNYPELELNFRKMLTTRNEVIYSFYIIRIQNENKREACKFLFFSNEYQSLEDATCNAKEVMSQLFAQNEPCLQD